MIHNCKIPKIQDCIFFSYRRYLTSKNLYICRRKGFRIADYAMKNEKGMQWESATIPVAVSSCPKHGAQKVLQSLPLAARLGRRKTGTSQKTCRCIYKICNLRVYGWKSKQRFPPASGIPVYYEASDSPAKGVNPFWISVVPYPERIRCKGQNENSKREKRDETIVK